MIRLVTLLVAAGALSVHGSETPGGAKQDPPTTQLRVRGTVTVETVPEVFVETVSGNRTFLFVGPWRCDSRGNVYFVPATPATLNRPDRLVRISPEGRLLTLSPRTITDRSALKAAVLSTSMGPGGRLHVLVQNEVSQTVHQRIVSFTPTGEEDPADRAIQLNTQQILGRHFSILGTGDVVVLGHDPLSGGERLALVSRTGTVLQDVDAPQDIVTTSGPLPWPPGFTWLGPGSDGLAYLVRERARRVLAISPAGVVVRTFELVVPAPAAMRLSALHVAGNRMAAVYRAENGTGRWIQVQDLVTGDLVGTYGPVANPVVCYQRDERDWFTLLSTAGGAWRLTLAEIP